MERAAMEKMNAALHNPAEIDKYQQQEQAFRQELDAVQRQLRVLAGDTLSYQDLLWGQWDGFDMHSAVFAPGYMAPISTSAPTAVRGLGPNAGSMGAFNASEFVRQHMPGTSF